LFCYDLKNINASVLTMNH